MKKPVALGANIFAGGFSLGVSKHFRLLGHLEHDNYGAAVSHGNLGVPIYVGMDQWPEKLPVRLDFLYANPPCAIWSVAGAKVGGNNWRVDPRLQRIRDIFGLVDRYRPAVWCWESVCQAFSKGREFVEKLADEAKDRGYSATYVLVDAQYLGVPQVRKRFFLVLHNIEISWKAPDFTSVITSGQALKGVRPKKELLGRPTPGEIKMLRTAKPGQRLSRIYDRITKHPKLGARGQKLGRPSFLKHRLDPSRPSNTVIGNAIFHPKENRFLAVNECAALSGYPQLWKWPKSDGYNLLARGVMPPVGEWLARHVAAAIRKGRALRKPGRWLVDFRAPPGSILEVGKLPAEVDLNWKPGRPNRPARTLQAASSRAAQVRAPRRLSSLAEASDGVDRLVGTNIGRTRLPLIALTEISRKGVPDQENKKLIKSTLAGLKKGKLPGSSGLLIRARLLEGKLSDAMIVAEVLKKYEGRKTTSADVSWHRGKMRRAGMIT
jgi:site-specific DNA-cytosine methylase